MGMSLNHTIVVARDEENTIGYFRNPTNSSF
jgi:hypothetical protein